MATDAPQAETSPNRRLSLESCTTRGTSSEKENLLSEGRLNEPVVQKRPKPNSRPWRKTPNQSHDPLEDLRSRGKTQAKSQELENFAKRHELKKVFGIRMHRKKQIHFLQDDVSCSQKREIQYWPPRPQVLPDINKTAVIAARRKRSQIEGSLSEQRLHHLAQGVYPDDAETKNLHDPASRPNKKRKMDACGRKMSPHAEPPEVRCTYWYHPVAYY